MADQATLKALFDKDKANNEEKEEGGSKFTPLTWITQGYYKRKFEQERRLLGREEQMKQDIERFLMEIEERHSWISFELTERNLLRMTKEHKILSSKKAAEKKLQDEQDEINKEVGLSYHRGTINKYKRWQNDPCKHLDFTGHQEAVYSVKLSKCHQFILTCSGDKNARLWKLSTGKCLQIYYGHTRNVNDGDFHPYAFHEYTTKLCIITCGVDCTLRFWNTRSDTPVRTIKAHDESIYRCRFSPDGNRIVTSSEDKTIRTWCFPDGYVLFVYKGHMSGIPCVTFSPTGRYLVSGSDYAERKVYLWDASLPSYDQPVQFAHQLYWTPDGLLKRVLIKKGTPPPTFWLTASEMDLVEDAAIDQWPGTQEDDEIIDSDSENSGDEDDENKPKFGDSDVRDLDGVTVAAIAVDLEGNQTMATEYIPGHYLAFIVQSVGVTVTEAFITVHAIRAMYDIFSEEAGLRIGTFKLDAPLPWEMDKAIIDPTGIRKPKRNLPDDIICAIDGQAILYQKEPVYQTNPENFEEEEIIIPANFGAIWMCPGPDLGPAIIKVNYKINKGAHRDKWYTLTYSLQESLQRMTVTPGGGGGGKPKASSRPFLFDQESKHAAFWNFIKEKNWEAVESFIDKKCIFYKDFYVKRRRWRVVESLEKMFGKQVDLIAPNPIIFKDGITKSVVMADNMPFNLDDSSSEEDDDGDSDDEESDSEDGDEKADNKTEKVEEVNESVAAEESKAVIDVDDEEGAEVNMESPENDIDEANEKENDLKLETVAEGNEEEHDGVEGEIFSSNVDAENEDDKKESIKINEQEDGSNAQIKESEERPATASAAPAFNPLAAILAKNSKKKDEPVEEVFVFRPRAHKQWLPEVIFTRDVDGREFEKDVQNCSTEEATNILAMFASRYPTQLVEEIRSYPLDIVRYRPILELPMMPGWIKNFHLDVVTGGDSKNLETHSNLMDLLKSKNYFPVTNHPNLKSDKFGPDIEKFVMQLPKYFPKKAGYAQNAIKMQLADTEKRIQNAENNRLPTTSETNSKFKKIWKKFKNKFSIEKQLALMKDLKDSVEDDIRLHLVAERTYIGTRRNALAMLPGMEPHYPNSNYREPCSEDYEYIELPKKSFFASLFNRKIVKTTIVPYVGRRPRLEEAKGEEVQDDEVNDKERPPSTISSRPNTSQNPQRMKGDRPESNSGDRPGTTNTKEDLVESAKEGKSHKSHRRRRRDMQEQVEEHKEEAPPEIDPEMEALMLLEGEEKVKQEKILKDKKWRKKNGIPQDVFLGRRGSFPFAPGLEPLSADVKDPLTPSEEMHMKPIPQETENRPGTADTDYLNSRPATADNKDTNIINEVTNLDDETSEEKKEDQQMKVALFVKPKDPPPRGLIRKFTFLSGETLHHGGINDVVFSPSEARIATAGGDNLVKIWDPRDGTHVRSLVGHTDEVTGVQFSGDELYLVSVGADPAILIWDLTTNLIIRKLRGHSDIITAVSISNDCTTLATSSYDCVVKTWFMTPRVPDTPAPPRLISKTDTTAIVSWVAPSSFGLEITAYHLQWRIGSHGVWTPHPEPLSIAPIFRNRNVKGLIASTAYQFRICAENKMGRGHWSPPSKTFSTDYGLPLQVERPTVVKITRTSMMVFLFVANPETFGAASTRFEIVFEGEGRHFDDNPIKPFTLQEARDEGQRLLKTFHNIMNPTPGLYGKARIADRAQYECYRIANSTMLDLFQRVKEDEHHIFIAVEVFGLHPGYMYRHQIRGINNAGQGDWSEASYSIYSASDRPEPPKPPHIESATLTSITYAWHAPHNNGAAITGYRVNVQHTGRVEDLPRTQNTFTVHDLQPGKSYFLRVMAINNEGESDWSSWNDVSQSKTVTDKPEMPKQPRSIWANWNSMMIEAVLSYGNGSKIFEMTVQRRTVEPFQKGEWEKPTTLRFPEDVEIINYIDPEEQMREAQMMAMKLAQEKAMSDYNPFKKEKAHAPNVLTPEEELANLKPDGSRFRFKMLDCPADTVFEFRICYRNDAGISVYSPPSHRAKTNRAEVPHMSDSPKIVEALNESILVELHVPQQGGSPITEFVVEMKDISGEDGLREELYDVKDSHELAHKSPQIRFKNVRPGGIYYIRSRAGNIIGLGEWSVWSDEVLMPETVVAPTAATTTIVAKPDEDDAKSDEDEDENENDFEGLLPTAPPTDMNIKLPPSSSRK